MNRHPTEHEWRAWLDSETSPAQGQRMAQHFNECGLCRSKADALQTRSSKVQARLGRMLAQPVARREALTARARLEERILHKDREKSKMNDFGSRPKMRPAWVAGLVILLLAVSLAIPSVRAAAGSFLDIFRVEQITVLPVNPAAMRGNMQAGGPSLEKLLADTLQYTTEGERQSAADGQEAEDLAGFNVRLPASEAPAALTVQPDAHGEMTVDLQRLRLVLKEMERDDVTLPDALDAAVIEISAPRSVLAGYGNCESIEPPMDDPQQLEEGAATTFGGRDCISLLQMPSPQVTIPEGLDLNELGMAFLQMTGMSLEEAQQASQNINWANTLVVPVPVEDADYSTLDVDGVQGTLVVAGHGASQYAILWVKDGILYALNGSGDSSRGLALIESLE